MGIQLRVEMADIPATWETEVWVEGSRDSSCQWDCPSCGGDGCLRETKRLRVKFPKSGWAMSYVEDALVIDNKNANHHFRFELIENGIPYSRGQEDHSHYPITTS